MVEWVNLFHNYLLQFLSRPTLLLIYGFSFGTLAVLGYIVYRWPDISEQFQELHLIESKDESLY